MHHVEVWSSIKSLKVLALGVLLLAAPAAAAQERLNAAKLEDNDTRRLQQLASGREEYTDEYKALLDKAAQWYIYRLTHSEYQFKNNPEAGSTALTMSYLVGDVSKHIVTPTPQKPLNANQRKFMKAFAEALVTHIKKVLVNPVPIARVNAAIVLAHLGDTGLEEMVGPLCDVLEGKGAPEGGYDDAVKLYALIGLKNLFKAQGEKDGDVIRYNRIKSEENERRCVRALLNFIARKPAYGSSAPPDEIEAFRYIRREAIRALGWVMTPVEVKDAVVETMPAVELARIIANPDGLTPGASLSEQLEAAIGLCRLKNRRSPDRNPYQQEYAAFFVGQLVVSFATRAATERNDPASTIDWKYSAYRLNEALAELERDSLGRSAYIKELVGRASRILKSIQEGKAEGLETLSDFLLQKKPVVMEMFKGKPETAIPLAAPAGEK